eukprot:10048285-Alexandrium_andersonii.AAC.1
MRRAPGTDLGAAPGDGPFGAGADRAKDGPLARRAGPSAQHQGGPLVQPAGGEHARTYNFH